MNPRLLTHASEWAPDPETTRLQLSLAELAAATMKAPPGAWAVALTARPRGVILEPLAIAITTQQDTCWLTHRMLRTAPLLWLHGGQMLVQLATPLDAEEIADEAAVCLTLRVLGYADERFDPPRISVMTAREIPPEGLLFVSNATTPPYGWPP